MIHPKACIVLKDDSAVAVHSPACALHGPGCLPLEASLTPMMVGTIAVIRKMPNTIVVQDIMH
jgi:hypothetical protein